ncbi:dehydroquinase class 1 [Grosmannia clavigera kw1407]|uniref:Dehydroquinase class 1 n=1 Tax=Grosmannia clavigera (strain kw1407 / UAMH 11150) TaxID=655863 RepID=F0XGK4_GROCL|nr:dehydroquinase class 1 [Grosmannia clavigera kw1407]EFX03193.1 dehydroquinase class 1 [Grosmannia clavigera kw1407]
MDLISARYSTGLKTYIVTLKFPDLEAAVDRLEKISYGGDCWEFRVDLLGPSSVAIPPLDYVRMQLRVLRDLPRKLPILFTVRTVSQGGRFPDDAANEALALMKLAAEQGCEYIDVEMSWPSFVIDGILTVKGAAKIVASFHEFDGSIKWTSQTVRAMCTEADAVGDIIKLCIQSVDINDCLELGLYVRDYQTRTSKPIIAVAMGTSGQLSRFTAPVTFVTHKLIPAPPGSDQLCLSDIHRALHLLGQLPSKRFYFAGPAVTYDSLLSPLFTSASEDLGFPYSTCHLEEVGQDLNALLARPDFGGAYVPSLCNQPIGKYVQSWTPVAEQIGIADTVLISTESGQKVLSGDNTAWMAVLACLKSSGSFVSENSTALVLGVEPRSSAAYYAMERFGIQNVMLVSQDEEAASQICNRFPHISFQIYARLKDVSAALVPGSSLAVFGDETGLESLDGDGLLDQFSGVMVDVGAVVKPASQQARLDRISKWKAYSALDVLQSHADALFRLWTGRNAPRTAADATLSANFKEKR